MLESGNQCEYNQAFAMTASSSGNQNALTTMSDSSSSDTITAQSSPSSSSQSTKEDRANLSRRQKKNRMKNSPEQQCDLYQQGQQQQQTYYPNYAVISNGGMPIWHFVPQPQGYFNCQIIRLKGTDGFISIVRQELLLKDADLAMFLRRYTLPWDQLVRYGYPMECNHYPGTVMIVNHFPLKHRIRQHYGLDVNAREFIPGSNSGKWLTLENEGDSGHSSANSDVEQESLSDSEKNSEKSKSTSSSSSDLTSEEASRTAKPAEKVRVMERNCARCNKSFYMNMDGNYISEESCSYHWGKLRNELVDYTEIRMWDCCYGEHNKPGCTTAKMHVWTGLTHGKNGPFDGFVRTKVATFVPEDGNYGVYALDCEMCFSRRGLELAKVTVVDMDGSIVYDTLVKPEAEVIDYSTRHSGITEHDLANVTKTLKDVQNDLTSFIHAETILIGHGLENDLRALKLIHTTVIDTSALYPHYLGFPFRCSLKALARGLLRREIQIREHNSVEDARTALDLVLKKIEYEFKISAGPF